MSTRIIDQTNFHRKSFGIFDRCKTPDTEPDYKSWTGSKYWFINGELIRQSDHWTHRIASCAWILCLGQDLKNEWVTAKIKFTDMSERSGLQARHSFSRRKRYKKIARQRYRKST